MVAARNQLPDRHLSRIYDNRARIETRVKLLQSGHRYSQEPPSSMRRLIGNVEVTWRTAAS